MKKQLLLALVAFFSISTAVIGQEVWKKVSLTKTFTQNELIIRKQQPTNFDVYNIDVAVLNTKLVKAIPRTSKTTNNLIVKLPTPLGIQRFLVKEASVLSKELAAKYPDIKSYVGIGLDDPTAIARFSKSVKGFHAMITSGNYPMYLIDPYTKDKNTSIAYYKKYSPKNSFECLVNDTKTTIANKTNVATSDGKLRTYRLALIGTAEYSQFHWSGSGATTDAEKKAVVLAAMNTTMTRVNGIFEIDLGVTMEIVANNTDLIFLNGATDNLSNNDGGDLIDESQTVCDATIGTANYDIGHAFSTGGGGLAGLGVVCETGQKAKGITGQGSPVGDGFDIDYVAHEMGHQFGANHTQNNDCQRNDATAVEPGSASTIMGYAGICTPNVQSNSDAFFHAVSIAEMWTVVTTTATCAVETVTGNAVPVANAGTDFVIPAGTAFVLRGSATDADGTGSLTYNWEQIDAEIALGMPPAINSTVGPAFRSLVSSTSPNRYMPTLARVVEGFTFSTWEVVSTVGRTYNFSLLVRDNVANGGATHRDDMKVTSDGDSGPFKVTSQALATTLNGNSTQTITWDVANSNASLVNCVNVNIWISTDGGLTFPTRLSMSTPNDGTEDVVLPNVTTSQARIMVEGDGNIFYAVNSTNFSIDEVVSVDEFSFSNFSVYPNPSNGRVTLSFDVISTDKVTVQLFDIRGRLIDEQQYLNTPNAFSKTLNYEKVVSGLYVLHIKNGTKSSTRKLLIN